MSSLGLSRKEKDQYSLTRAILAAVKSDWRAAPHEHALSQAEYERRGTLPSNARSFAIPQDILERDLIVASGGGAYLVHDDAPKTFVDFLRANSIADALGVQRLPGLVGTQAIPKATAGSTGYWLADETTQITASQPTVGQLTMTPKNVAAYISTTHRFITQTSEAAQNFILRDLAGQIRSAVDVAIVAGSGASGEPTGVVTQAAGAFTGTSLDFAKLLNAHSDLAAANALTPQAALVTTPAVAALLAARVQFASTASPLWVGSLSRGTSLGHLAISSASMPAATAIFGDFTTVILGEWGGLELMTNPFADFTRGYIALRAFYSVDVGVRAPGAFSVATSIT